jgi:hypothetical protein
MARRPAHLGRRHPQPPHPTPRSLVDRTSLPHLERPQRLRPHQAGLPDCGELGSLTSFSADSFVDTNHADHAKERSGRASWHRDGPPDRYDAESHVVTAAQGDPVRDTVGWRAYSNRGNPE